jgi:RNA polymerase sigma-70 factor (ECF subfamily)
LLRATFLDRCLYYSKGLMAEPTDRALVESTLGGDVEAFGELVQRYQGSVFGVCYRIIGERQAAEDQVQEAFLRAHQRLHTFKLDKPFGPWIRRVAANLCLNALRAAGPIRLPLEDERDLPLEPASTNPERQTQRDEQAENVRAAIRRLPPHYRAVIELRHFHELSYAEIGETLGLPLSDVRSHLYRARRALAEDLASPHE